MFDLCDPAPGRKSRTKYIYECDNARHNGRARLGEKDPKKMIVWLTGLPLALLERHGAQRQRRDASVGLLSPLFTSSAADEPQSIELRTSDD